MVWGYVPAGSDPCLLYTSEKGKGGVSCEDRDAFCFETQMYPDSVNHPQFPSPVVKAGTAHVTRTSYRFYMGK